MNPNPQLILDEPSVDPFPSSTPDTPPQALTHTSTSSLVSWEDLNSQASSSHVTSKASSRASRSGLSSPAIEPALSPLTTSKVRKQTLNVVPWTWGRRREHPAHASLSLSLFSSQSKLKFDSHPKMISETLTQAAGRLQNLQDAQNASQPPESSPRVVQFSAQRRQIDDRPTSPFDLQADEGRDEHHVAFTLEARSAGVPPPSPSPSADAANNAAERLKRLIRRAEAGGSRQEVRQIVRSSFHRCC